MAWAWARDHNMRIKKSTCYKLGKFILPNTHRQVYKYHCTLYLPHNSDPACNDVRFLVAF